MIVLNFHKGAAIQASGFDHTNERVAIAMMEGDKAMSVVLTLAEMEQHIAECEATLKTCRERTDAELNARIVSLDKPAAA